jgi:hypothetical protein
MNANAWMIKQDGTAIPVLYHPYGYNKGTSVEENLYAITFLHKYDNNEKVEEAIDIWVAQVLSACAASDGSEAISFRMLEDAFGRFYGDGLKGLFFEDFSLKTAWSVHERLNRYGTIAKLHEYMASSRDYDGSNLSEQLNQRFLRARFGGEMDFAPETRELWFRISSTGFNWYGIIYKFTAELHAERNITDVTIVRDLESTGSEQVYTRKNVKYEHVPIDDFLSEDLASSPMLEKRLAGGTRSVPTIKRLIRQGMLLSEVQRLYGEKEGADGLIAKVMNGLESAKLAERTARPAKPET